MLVPLGKTGIMVAIAMFQIRFPIRPHGRGCAEQTVGSDGMNPDQYGVQTELKTNALITNWVSRETFQHFNISTLKTLKVENIVFEHKGFNLYTLYCSIFYNE